MTCENGLNIPICTGEVTIDPENLPLGGIDYSSEEQWTGRRWIDGRKIYQKTLTVQVASGAGYDVLHGVDNLDEGVAVFGIQYGNNTWWPLPYVSQLTGNPQRGVSLSFDRTKIRIQNNQAYAGKAVIHIQYTCTDR